jgi:ubiquinol-cytochrome c reductase cytochrome b subunit
MLNWLNDRTGCRDAWRRWADAPIPGGAGWRRVLPAAILCIFCTQVITGFVLWTYYSPSTLTAWESVYYLQSEVAGGWLLRAVHHYAAQTAAVLVGLYLLQQILTGAYRAPREAVFWVTLLLALAALGLLLTGDLLAWNQNGYTATKTRAGFLKILLSGSDDLFRLAAGGPDFGHLTLTRFLAFHIGLGAGGFLLLLILHGIFVRRADAVLAEKAAATSPRWPNQAWRSATACLGVLAVVLALALSHGTTGPDRGVTLGSPADHANPFAAARPEWIFRALYQFSEFFPGQLAWIPIFLVPGIVFLLFVLMPFFGKRTLGHLFNLGLTIFLIAAAALLSYLSYARDARDPAYQLAVTEENMLAHRAVELARAKGIPPEGALTLLRNDILAQGGRLFKQHCTTCHAGGGYLAEEATAPNLTGYATRQWLTGFLNPQTIGSADYFGYKNSPFKGGKMVDFIKDTFSDLDPQGKEDLRKVVLALSAEAQLPTQREIDARDAQAVEEGRRLITDDFGCTDCHRFRGKGERVGPELTGYGSRKWIAAMIGNPASKRYYGKRNDRMPAYAETDDETKNLLPHKDVNMLADWLRGDWFRPPMDQ